MKFKFVDYKSDSTYITLLAKLAIRYCNNLDGRIYATFSDNKDNDDLIELLISQLVPVPVIVSKKNAIILNLLVNPFFDDLCEYLCKNPKIGFCKSHLIKKYIFSYLVDDYTRHIYSDSKLPVEGGEIYIKKNMYERSKKMLEIL